MKIVFSLDLPPLVSTILGVDTKTNYLYGVGNNGKGYVQSEDEGQTWASIPPNVFDNAQRSSSFKKALLKWYTYNLVYWLWTDAVGFNFGNNNYDLNKNW